MASPLLESAAFNRLLPHTGNPTRQHSQHSCSCLQASSHLVTPFHTSSLNMQVHRLMSTYNSVTAPGAAVVHSGQPLHTKALRKGSPCGVDKAAAAHGQQLQTNRVQLLRVHMPTLLEATGRQRSPGYTILRRQYDSARHGKVQVNGGPFHDLVAKTHRTSTNFSQPHPGCCRGLLFLTQTGRCGCLCPGTSSCSAPCHG